MSRVSCCYADILLEVPPGPQVKAHTPRPLLHTKLRQPFTCHGLMLCRWPSQGAQATTTATRKLCANLSSAMPFFVCRWPTSPPAARASAATLLGRPSARARPTTPVGPPLCWREWRGWWSPLCCPMPTLGGLRASAAAHHQLGLVPGGHAGLTLARERMASSRPEACGCDGGCLSAATRHTASWLLPALAIPGGFAYTSSTYQSNNVGVLFSCLPSALTYPRQAVCAGGLFRQSAISVCNCVRSCAAEHCSCREVSQPYAVLTGYCTGLAAGSHSLLTMAQGKHGLTMYQSCGHTCSCLPGAGSGCSAGSAGGSHHHAAGWPACKPGPVAVWAAHPGRRQRLPPQVGQDMTCSAVPSQMPQQRGLQCGSCTCFRSHKLVSACSHTLWCWPICRSSRLTGNPAVVVPLSRLDCEGLRHVVDSEPVAQHDRISEWAESNPLSSTLGIEPDLMASAGSGVTQS